MAKNNCMGFLFAYAGMILAGAGGYTLGDEVFGDHSTAVILAIIFAIMGFVLCSVLPIGVDAVVTKYAPCFGGGSTAPAIR